MRLVYDRNRYYDPRDGRFMQEDPAGLAGGANLYGYAGADPANNSDPFGLSCVVEDTGKPCPDDTGRRLKAVGSALLQAVGQAVDRMFTAAFGNPGGALPEGVGGAGSAMEETASISGMLREASAGTGNFGLGSASAGEAELAGHAWVGEGAKLASDGKTMVSSDGLRQYRPATYKPGIGKVQANLESRSKPEGAWQNNGHIDIRPDH